MMEQKCLLLNHNRNIIEWTLTTPYDIDTASTTFNAGQGFDTNANQKRSNDSIAFNNDGTKMFVTGETTKQETLNQFMNTHLIPHLLLHQALLMFNKYNPNFSTRLYRRNCL